MQIEGNSYVPLHLFEKPTGDDSGKFLFYNLKVYVYISRELWFFSPC